MSTKGEKTKMYCSMLPCAAMTMWVRPMRRMMSAACRPPASAGTKRATTAPPAAAIPRDIIDTTLAAGSFKKLLSALIASGLAETLKGSGPFTVFAPGDTAFAELPAGTLDDLLKPENRERLKSVLTFHVIPGRLTAAELVNARSLTTVSGKELFLHLALSGLSGAELRASLRVGGAGIVTADIACTNGIIHVIDRVLIPAAQSGNPKWLE